jgi:DEAD/DEAH box helicase domain-containing protein
VKRKGEIEHAAWCLYRKETKEEKEKAVRACYLFRDFTSEAIRMLLPVSAAAVDRYIESFIAALELRFAEAVQG